MQIPSGGRIYDKKEASPAFEDSGYGTSTLMIALDYKLRLISTFHKARGIWLTDWLKQNRSDVWGAVFSAAELASGDRDVPCAYILAPRARTNAINVELGNTPIACLRSIALGVETIGQICSISNQRSEWRALLSGEMLVIATSEFNRDMLLGIMHDVQRVFDDGRAPGDLGMLIARDVFHEARRGTKEREVSLSNDRFQDLASKAMRKRRVEPRLMPRLMPLARQSFSSGRHESSALRTLRS